MCPDHMNEVDMSERRPLSAWITQDTGMNTAFDVVLMTT